MAQQALDQEFDHWCISHRHQRFRKARGERPEARSTASGQNYGTHAGGSGGAITLVRETSLTLENAGSSTLPSTPDSISRATGVISGTPTLRGTFQFQIRVTDSAMATQAGRARTFLTKSMRLTVG